MQTDINLFPDMDEDDGEVKVVIKTREDSVWAKLTFGHHDDTFNVICFDTSERVCDWLTRIHDEIETALTWYRSEVDGEGEDTCPCGNPADSNFKAGDNVACSRECAARQVE